MKILFVCRSNILRSKIAEAYFKKINKNQKIRVSSAGFRTDGDPLYDTEKEVAKEFNLKLSPKIRKINKKIIEDSDIVILVADNVDPKEISAKKLIVWKIEDPKENFDKERVKKVFLSVMREVENLVKELN